MLTSLGARPSQNKTLTVEIENIHILRCFPAFSTLFLWSKVLAASRLYFREKCWYFSIHT